MPRNCNFPNCGYSGNGYRKTRSRSMFSLPSDIDKRKRLLRQLEISEDSIAMLSSFHICSEHFTKSSIILKDGKTFLGENPTIIGREHLQIFSDKIGTFPEFIEHLPKVLGNLIEGFGWKVMMAVDNSFICLYMQKLDNRKGLSITENIVVNSDMSFFVASKTGQRNYKRLVLWEELASILSEDISIKKPETILNKSISRLNEVAVHPLIAEDSKVSTKLNFLINQLQNVLVLPSCRRYSVDTMCASIMVHTMSRAAFDGLREYLTLPSERQLEKCLGNHDKTDEQSPNQP